ncbi:MAG: exopolysaccharide biosynthesis protein [Roseibium sp.]|uniref:exopolysaccharide biosynthesis protein n=1 Tax=Roseibium sp. TaxID=1936156 RepID=UPI003297F674
MNSTHLKLSEVLRNLRRDIDALTEGDRDVINLSALFSIIGEQAAAALLLIFSLITLVPNIPGATSFLGIPVVGICAMMLIWGQVWLPGSLRRLSISRERLTGFLTRAIPLVEKVEKLARPRAAWIFVGRRERAIWAWALILAVSVLIPLPFTAMLPSLCLCLMAIGLMERDGLWVMIGSALGVAALAVTVVVAKALIGLLFLAL